jgi:hypothetical protein
LRLAKTFEKGFSIYGVLVGMQHGIGQAEQVNTDAQLRPSQEEKKKYSAQLRPSQEEKKKNSPVVVNSRALGSVHHG